MSSPYRTEGDNMDIDISAGSQWWWKLPAALALLGMVAALLGAFAVGLRSCAEPSQCAETAEIIDISHTARRCDPGARMWTESMSDNRLTVHCSCGAVIDAGIAR